MEAINIFPCLALFVFLLLLFKLLITKTDQNKNQKKNLPPSPPNPLPILGHLHLLKKPLHQSLAQLSAQHGQILLCRFGIRPVLVVSSAPLADECFTTNDLSFANRPKFPSTRLSTYNHTSLGSAPYGPHWRDMRRLATIEVLSGHRLSFFSDVRADEARALAHRLFLDTTREDFAKVELRSRLFGLAMNVMMKMMVGKRYYGEESGDDDARRFRELVEESFTLAGASNVGDFLPSVIGWFTRRRVQSRLAHIHPISMAEQEEDCYRWNNAANILCYGCDSCKAGVLEQVRRDWHKLSVLNVVIVIFLIAVYALGCCAFRNARRSISDHPHGDNRMSKIRPHWDHYWGRWWQNRRDQLW